MPVSGRQAPPGAQGNRHTASPWGQGKDIPGDLTSRVSARPQHGAALSTVSILLLSGVDQNASSSFSDAETRMVNFMCHVGWTKHYSGCFCESVFGWDYHFNQWAWVEQIAFHSVSGFLLISWKPEQNKRLPSSREEGISQQAVYRLELQ